MTLFRVRFSDGTSMDVQADRPDAARVTALKQRPTGKIVKVKVLREAPAMASA